MTPEELDALKYWADIISKRGYAKKYAKFSVEDLAIVERMVAREWAATVDLKWNMKVSEIHSNETPNGVPDVFGTLNDTKIGIELTEFVDEAFLDKVQDSKPNAAPLGLHAYNSHFGPGFLDSQWNQDKFLKLLKCCIEKKNKKYLKNGHVVDVLILHTDEDWLTIEDVEMWLSTQLFGAYSTLKSCYFLMYARPGTDDPATVFKLF